jgi:sarcosine oxidase
MPAYPQVSVFVGAGHAYKWASLIGLILAQIAVNGQTTYPIDAFRITRYASRLCNVPNSANATSTARPALQNAKTPKL